MTAEIYAPFIPYLRRFTRALTGDQIEGDAGVWKALKRVVAESYDRTSDVPAKIRLYRAFYETWANTEGRVTNRCERPFSPGTRVRRLPSVQRVAFLLSALEGMTNIDISQIMQIAPSEVVNLLNSAEASIEQELATSVLIIEDEPFIALDIQGIVEELGHKVCGVADTHQSALDLIKVSEPGIILSDIRLADGSCGIDAVDEILNEDDLPVIFVTACPEDFLTGNKPEPAYLISKPYESENLKAAISQALFFHHAAA